MRRCFFIKPCCSREDRRAYEENVDQMVCCLFWSQDGIYNSCVLRSNVKYDMLGH